MSLAKHISKVVEGSGKKSLLGFIFSWEGVLAAADGNFAHNKLIKGPVDGTLVGTDKFGNKYYENEQLGYERKRWVVYGNSFNYSPTSVPAEWHGWLNYINDYTPTNYDFKKPAYAVDHYQTRTGSPLCYQPKGAWAHGDAKRAWKKYEAWQPPKA